MNIFGNQPINYIYRNNTHLRRQQRRGSTDVSPLASLSPITMSPLSSASSHGSMRDAIFMDMREVDKIRRLRDKYVKKRKSSVNTRRRSQSPRRNSSPMRSNKSPLRRRNSSPIRNNKSLVRRRRSPLRKY
jgi:hypothetical protein